MKEQDDIHELPSIVPSREDRASHKHNRKLQTQEIVKPGYYTEKIKVSTWPVRIMIGILTLSTLGAGAGAYYFYEQYQAELNRTEIRLADLENRLSLVGNSAEETSLNIKETLDFHFSEIDKLWGTRNATNTTINDMKSELARLVLVNQGQDEAVANASKQVADVGAQINASNTRLNTLVSEMDKLNQSNTALNRAMDSFQSLRGDLDSVRAALNSGDSNLAGLIGRLGYVEESLESINAHRLQINESIFRLQESIETLQRNQASSSLR
jgi:chromosome segregation ATPase